MALAILLIAAPAAALTPLPPQPDGVPWPTQIWATGPLPAGTDATALEAALAEPFDDKPDDYQNTSAVVIVQGGRIAREHYAEGFGPDTRLNSWSVAKSFTQALVGVAVAEGRVDIDQPMGNRRWSDDDPRSRIPWRQWLNMIDGQSFQEFGGILPSQNDVGPMLFGEGRLDVAAFAASLPLENPPGTTWNYNSAGVNLIADALTDTIAGSRPTPAARRNTMLEWMRAGLFDPLGMRSTQPEFDAAGLFLGSSFIYATARDFARFGLLYLRDGVWDGEQVLPAGWVDFARTATPVDGIGFYGAGWWLGFPGAADSNPALEAFRAQGRGGQVILIVPSKDLVIVRMGNNESSAGRR
ncbi:MAG: serine hydrolase, partial [Hyphomicrobiales bacterium]|nr:serine hydrolase [Hyphomicrobiales bacterium]